MLTLIKGHNYPSNYSKIGDKLLLYGAFEAIIGRFFLIMHETDFNSLLTLQKDPVPQFPFWLFWA